MARLLIQILLEMYGVLEDQLTAQMKVSLVMSMVHQHGGLPQSHPQNRDSLILFPKLHLNRQMEEEDGVHLMTKVEVVGPQRLMKNHRQMIHQRLYL